MEIRTRAELAQALRRQRRALLDGFFSGEADPGAMFATPTGASNGRAERLTGSLGGREARDAHRDSLCGGRPVGRGLPRDRSLEIARTLAGLLFVAAFAVGPWAAAAPHPDGAVLYLGHCAFCHGITGNGDGPDASLFRPGPRNLRDGFFAGPAGVELVQVVIDGARRPLTIDAATLGARLTDVEAIVAHLQTMPDVNWRLVFRGQSFYMERCERCHGPFGRPVWPYATRPPPRDLSSQAFQRGIGDRDLVRAVRHGRPNMPPIPTLRSDACAGALISYVRILSPGFELYSRHCASCHGDDGHPQREFVEESQRPPVTFDRAWLARRDAMQLRAAASHMLDQRPPSMPHFRRTLSEAQLRAIVQHLRAEP